MLYGDLLLAKGPLDEGALDDVITSYQSALSTRPNVANLRRNLATTLVMRGRYEEAVPHFHRVIELNPQDSKNYVELGNLFARLGRYQEAEKSYVDAIQVDADTAAVSSTHLTLPTICSV